MWTHLLLHSITLISMVIGSLFATTMNEVFSDNYNPDEPLFLTKYIESGNIEMVCPYNLKWNI